MSFLDSTEFSFSILNKSRKISYQHYPNHKQDEDRATFEAIHFGWMFDHFCLIALHYDSLVLVPVEKLISLKHYRDDIKLTVYLIRFIFTATILH